MNIVILELPACYRQGGEQENIADALTAGFSEKISQYNREIDNYGASYLNPATCKPEWLDYLSQVAGWGSLWDSSWAIATKRILLANTDRIWRTRGSKLILPYLFSVFGLDAVLSPSTGFILNQTLFPGDLSADPFSYTIKVPASYTAVSPEYLLIKRLIRDFLPCWISLDISF